MFFYVFGIRVAGPISCHIVLYELVTAVCLLVLFGANYFSGRFGKHTSPSMPKSYVSIMLQT